MAAVVHCAVKHRVFQAADVDLTLDFRVSIVAIGGPTVVAGSQVVDAVCRRVFWVIALGLEDYQRWELVAFLNQLGVLIDGRAVGATSGVRAFGVDVHEGNLDDDRGLRFGIGFRLGLFGSHIALTFSKRLL